MLAIGLLEIIKNNNIFWQVVDRLRAIMSDNGVNTDAYFSN